jgi:hypothetical protein
MSTTRPLNRCRKYSRGHPFTGTGRAARNFISIVILPADGTALANGWSGDFGTSPIYRQLSNKPLFGVPNVSHNGGSRIYVLKISLSSGIAGAAPTYRLVATAPLAERHVSALHRHRAEVPPQGDR